ncbi:sulfotransferase family protein [Glaciecola sp. MF2-115]|uniref:sulfotransferase family protein n=1 Tax=Glaciecola sp. MF2-115 TaxID=3384827 RepID=UPI0039A1F263
MPDELEQAIAHFNANNFSSAKKSLKKIKANSFTKRKLEFAILLKEEKYQKCLPIGKRLLTETNDSAEVVEIANSMARCCINLGDAASAEHYFELSIAKNSSVSNGESLIHLLKLYSLRDHLVNIEKLAPKALGWERHSIEAQMLLLESASKFGSKLLVEERVRKLFLELEKLDREQFATFIDYLIGLGVDDLREIACEKYEKKFQTVVLSNRVDGLLKDNKIVEALETLQMHADSNKSVRHQQLLAKVFHSNGDYASAFNAWETAGSIRKSRDASIKIHLNKAKKRYSEYKGLIPKLQNSSDFMQGEEGKNYVFIFGFPRSGTTLLDNVLDTQVNLLVLSERKILPSAANVMKNFGKKHPKDIWNLSDEELVILRERYIDIIENEQGYSIPESGIVVEKNPHFTEQLPLIKKLFPGAKLILTIRHPLDVCLSCLQQNFTMNSYNAHMLSMQDIVAHYVSTFTLLERYEQELGIKVHCVKYEDLVEDLAGEMEKVFDFIGFKADNTYLNFHTHAGEKYVTSASRGQTNQPLYQSSKYKWKKYEEQLKPYIPDLKYFIDKYGYNT